MATELTERGQEAQRILDWVWEDIDGRAAEGRERLAQLTEGASETELREIQDAGLMIARLMD